MQGRGYRRNPGSLTPLVPGVPRQFGPASAPMIPHLVHTILGPNVGTGTPSDHGAALRIARWWHASATYRTPFARILPRVIGSIGFVEVKNPDNPRCDGTGSEPGSPHRRNVACEAHLSGLRRRVPQGVLRPGFETPG
jgi:hypothetical protein